MLEPDPLEELLAKVALELAQYVPGEAAAVAEHLRLEKLSQQVDEHDKPTKEAHRANTRLRNPFLVEETPQRSRHKVEKQERDQHKKMVKTISNALVTWAAWRTQTRKIDILDAHEDRSLPVEKSREQHGPESVFTQGYPLLERLAHEKVSPSSFGRLPTFAMVFIADLIKGYTRDTKFADPENPWNRIIRAGLLEAYHDNLTEDEQKVIAHAAAIRDEGESDWAHKARVELDLPTGFSRHFLEGAALIANASRDLTTGEAAAYNAAYALAPTRDSELLAKVLGLDPVADRPQLTALVHFLASVRPYQLDDLKFTIQLTSFKQAIDRIEPQKKITSDWVPELLELLPDLAFNLGGSVDSLEAFDQLFRHGLRLTQAREDFRMRAEEQNRQDRDERFAEDLREALEEGDEFKIDDGILWRPFHDEYGDIDAEVWTSQRWTEVHEGGPHQSHEGLLDHTAKADPGSGDQLIDLTSMAATSGPPAMEAGPVVDIAEDPRSWEQPKQPDIAAADADRISDRTAAAYPLIDDENGEVLPLQRAFKLDDMEDDWDE